MKKEQENMTFAFIRRRAEQLYSEGRVTLARRLLKRLDAEQERRFESYRTERIPLAR